MEADQQAQEGQGSLLLLELARIELLGLAGMVGIGRMGVRFGDIALESPGNLRLARTLLNLRLLDENGYTGPGGVDEELVEGSDESHTLLTLWEILLDVEEFALAETRRFKGAGRERALGEIQRIFRELEERLGEYKIEHKVEGKRLTEEIRPANLGSFPPDES